MNIIRLIVLLLIAAGLIAVSALQFLEKGPLLNNAWLFASEQERKTMNKAPHYRQSGIVFGLLGVIFALIGLETILHTGWLYYIVWATAFATVIYAVVSSVKGGR